MRILNILVSSSLLSHPHKKLDTVQRLVFFFVRSNLFIDFCFHLILDLRFALSFNPHRIAFINWAELLLIHSTFGYSFSLNFLLSSLCFLPLFGF